MPEASSRWKKLGAEVEFSPLSLVLIERGLYVFDEELTGWLEFGVSTTPRGEIRV